MRFDTQLFQFINQFAGQWLFVDTMAVFFADSSGYIFVGILVALLILKWRSYALVIFGTLTSGICAFFMTEVIRFSYNRPRPFETLDVIQLFEHELGNSFPSAHATFFFAMGIFLFLHSKKLGALFILWAFLISFFRIFSGVHYPLDIVGGFVVGMVTAIFFQKFIARTKISFPQIYVRNK